MGNSDFEPSDEQFEMKKNEVAKPLGVQWREYPSSLWEEDP